MRDAPKLFGWGSPQWIARMIRKPRSSDKYGFLDEKQENQMPAFGPDQIIVERPGRRGPLPQGRLRQAGREPEPSE